MNTMLQRSSRQGRARLDNDWGNMFDRVSLGLSTTNITLCLRMRLVDLAIAAEA